MMQWHGSLEPVMRSHGRFCNGNRGRRSVWSLDMYDAHYVDIGKEKL